MLSNVVDTVSLRLDCLRLATKPGSEPDEVIALATRYYEWCLSAPPRQPTKRGPKPQGD